MRGPTLLLAALIALATPLCAQSPSVALAGVVVDAERTPVGGAEVALSGRALRVVTNTEGVFRFEGVSAGSYELSVRKLGWTPATVQVVVGSRDASDVRIVLLRMTVLDTSRTIARQAWQRDFDDNRRIGLGHFFVADDIDRLKPANLSQLLSQVSGLRLARSRLGGKVVAYSGGATRTLSGTQCGLGRAADVYLDGVLVYRWHPNLPKDGLDLFDVNSIDPKRIAGIEYYARASQTPVQYQNLNSICGVLLIWTKR